jgi:hypothetical protein
MNTEDIILNKLEEINNRLYLIEQDLHYLKKCNNIITDHVSFVENVYDSIKTPFYYIVNKIKPIDKIPEKNHKLLQ